MNNHSYICRFIKDHPGDWESLLKKKEIMVKKEGNYALFRYFVDADFSDPVVQEARGIILDMERLEVVCWPFRKFGNFDESYADKIDWESAVVQEKIDGSIMKLWFDVKADRWRLSSNGMIDASEALTKASFGIKQISFEDLFYSALSNAGIDTEEKRKLWEKQLNKENTYIFELVSPYNRIFIRYDTNAIYHIGTRNNCTGQESAEDIGIMHPESFPLNSLQECLTAVKNLNHGCDTDQIRQEGFVVVDMNYNRIKIKTPEYLLQHRMMTSENISKKDILAMLLSPDVTTEGFCKASPDNAHIIKYYDYRLEELIHDAKALCLLADALKDEYGNDRKAIAGYLKGQKLSSVAFRHLDTRDKAEEIIRKYTRISTLCTLIPDYIPTDQGLSRMYIREQVKEEQIFSRDMEDREEEDIDR